MRAWRVEQPVDRAIQLVLAGIGHPEVGPERAAREDPAVASFEAGARMRAQMSATARSRSREGRRSSSALEPEGAQRCPGPRRRGRGAGCDRIAGPSAAGTKRSPARPRRTSSMNSAGQVADVAQRLGPDLARPRAPSGAAGGSRRSCPCSACASSRRGPHRLASSRWGVSPVRPCLSIGISAYMLQRVQAGAPSVNEAPAVLSRGPSGAGTSA